MPSGSPSNTPRAIVEDLAAILCLNWKPASALAIALSSEVFLRASEVVRATATDLDFPNEVRVRGTQTPWDIGGLVTLSSKTSLNQFLELQDERLLRRIAHFAKARDARDPFFASSYYRLEADFWSDIAHLGIRYIG